MDIFSKTLSYVTIKDVIRMYTNVTYSNHGIKCCFHNDTGRGNFHIKNNYGHCFSCDWHGNAINFVSESENISLTNACIKIINDFNLPIKVDKKNIFTKKEKCLFFRIKDVEQKLQNYTNGKYKKYMIIFKKSRCWLLENNDKCSLEYHFMLFLNTFSNKFCTYYEQNKKLNDIINCCLVVDKRIKTRWYEFCKIFNKYNQILDEGFRNDEILDLYIEIIGG